ncbi:type I restriction endonuclease subunit R [Brucella intermedia GD04153]|uniref:Type I restriction enzyme endonuclease subunit n=1 Tax=Brucella intermedia GD04153 TaxID=2975438 RepID=A0AA42KPL5_9HYPH|nr:type I restriction endonuclease subunit R [Brucella intermedia]MDH0125576.1 type I restriction endonuclease subunit R [Brucella intermedia GD04153]
MTKEVEIERELIKKLADLKYSHRDDICDREALERNFREKFEALNRVRLTDSEFERLLEEITTPDVFATAERLRNWNTFEREDGTPLHYQLVNLQDWCRNSFEVVAQLRMNTRSSHHRYDVILLLNGLPLVQIEIKSLHVSPRKAMQQIIDYRNDPGNGYGNSLLCFMQLFIVSNRSQTWYFANNNSEHFSFNVEERFLPIYRWATRDNRKVEHLSDFSDQFLAKCTLAEMISRYMVLIQNERKLVMMRPYQVYAVKAIVDCIHENRGNGYIWHTTGSGKTLTSFKTSTLLKDNPDIEKCLFVVDRKDLDKQTRDEFNRFQPGCVEENTNTETLVQRLLSDDYRHKVIVTTIQKLGLALDGTNKRQFRERLKPLSDKRIVFIFDECHRSQFGENHKAIREFFPNAQLFGFTGTPIFEQNATAVQIEGQEARLMTTDEVFEKELHAYTITHAIDDGNVLRFHVDYFKPDGSPIKPGETLARRAVVEAIVAKHDAATNQRKFNTLFATASIDDAIDYFRLFREVQAKRVEHDEDFVPLNIACVFSPPAEGNRDVAQLQEDLPQELEDNKKEPGRKKAALVEIIADYNARYGANHDLANFDSYYQDVQQRIKDQKYPNSDLPRSQKIDITIAVDMLLTGFDSAYLNTLYVDKNLKYHGLIQAFSRTNRVLNDSKPYGNILDFRAQRDAVDEAIALFSGEAPDRAKEVWLVDPAPKVIGKLEEATQKLTDFMAAHELQPRPDQVSNLKGDEARVGFIERFKEVKRLTTQLDQYTDLTPEQKAQIEALIPRDDLRAFSAQYLETARRLQQESRSKDDPVDPVQQLDFEFVLFDSALIDYDYIMRLIARFSQAAPKRLKMTREEIMRLLASSARLMEEREDLEAYIATLKEGEGLSEEQVRKGYEHFKAERQAAELALIAEKHNLSAEALQRFVDLILDRYIFDPDALSDLFRPRGLGWKARAQAELALMEDITPLLRRKAEGREISGLEVYEEY